MIRTREARVKDILSEKHGIQELEVEVEGKLERALSYIDILGRSEKGDRVLLNTTACYLELGTGGYHFVMANLDRTSSDLSGKGHIMKLRYTPLQVKCLAVEEQQSQWHERISNFQSLQGFPVVAASLHSMVSPICALIRKLRPGAKIGYVMTDGACLPIAFSKTVAELKEKGLLEVTVTCGNAFGGDLEAVNFYTGIIAAKEVSGCDTVIVGMGPGIVGTGTRYGFSGIEQGYIIDGINTLGGQPIAVPRISFADTRERHRGISHHTLTVLKYIAKTSSILPLPELEEPKRSIVKEQVQEHGLNNRHRVVYREGELVFGAMEEYGLRTTTMGRGIKDDPDFFLALGAAASVVCDYAG
jgi:hypothetical protein